MIVGGKKKGVHQAFCMVMMRRRGKTCGNSEVVLAVRVRSGRFAQRRLLATLTVMQSGLRPFPNRYPSTVLGDMESSRERGLGLTMTHGACGRIGWWWR